MARTRNPWGTRKTASSGRGANARKGSKIRRRLRQRRTVCASCGGDGCQQERVRSITRKLCRDGQTRDILGWATVAQPCRACNTTGKHAK